MGVSKNRGTPKWMVYNWKTLSKWMIWGYHYFWKPPYGLRNVTRLCRKIAPTMQLPSYRKNQLIKNIICLVPLKHVCMLVFVQSTKRSAFKT